LILVSLLEFLLNLSLDADHLRPTDLLDEVCLLEMVKISHQNDAGVKLSAKQLNIFKIDCKTTYSFNTGVLWKKQLKLTQVAKNHFAFATALLWH
jgi:hypothetical protein